MKKQINLQLLVLLMLSLFFATCKKFDSVEYSNNNVNNADITASVKGLKFTHKIFGYSIQ